MKEFLENVFSRTSIKPVDRTKIGTHEVYIADGFVEAERLPVLQRVFPGAFKAGQVGRDEFPNGCFATVWLTPGKIASRGGVRASTDRDQTRRISQIINDATEELTRVTH